MQHVQSLRGDKCKRDRDYFGEGTAKNALVLTLNSQDIVRYRLFIRDNEISVQGCGPFWNSNVKHSDINLRDHFLSFVLVNQRNWTIGSVLQCPMLLP